MEKQKKTPPKLSSKKVTTRFIVIMKTLYVVALGSKLMVVQ